MSEVALYASQEKFSSWDTSCLPEAFFNILFSLWLATVRDLPSEGTVIILVYIAGRLWELFIVLQGA